MKKKIVLFTFATCLAGSVCLADTVSINKGKNTTERVETRHYYKFKSDSDPKKTGWKMKEDRIFIQERGNNSKPEKKGR